MVIVNTNAVNGGIEQRGWFYWAALPAELSAPMDVQLKRYQEQFQMTINATVLTG